MTAHNMGTPMPPMQHPLPFANDPLRGPPFPQVRPQGPPFPQGGPQGPMDEWSLPQQINRDNSLASGMANLNLHNWAAGKFTPAVSQERSNKAPKQLDNESLKPIYEGWTFSPASPEEGQKPTWTCAYKKPMRLGQEALEKTAKDRKKTSAEQYKSLSMNRRSHVDRLIKEHNDEDHRFQWSCEYVKIKQQYVRKPLSGGAEVGTIEMDVVIMRNPRPEYAPRIPKSIPSKSVFVDLNAPSTVTETKPSKKTSPDWDLKNMEFPGHGLHFDRNPASGPHLGNTGPPAQQMHGPFPFGQHQPFPPREGPGDSAAHTKGAVKGPMNPMPEQQRPNPSVFHGMMQPQQPPGTPPGQRGRPGVQIIRDDIPPPPQVPSMHSSAQPRNAHGPFDPVMNDFAKRAHNNQPRNVHGPIDPVMNDFAKRAHNNQPRNVHGPFDPVMNDFAKRAHNNQAKVPAPKIFQQEHASPKPFKKQPAPELFSETSSVEDDESLLFDDMGYSSATTDIDEMPPFDRGNLHKSRKSSTQKESPSYRTHYRKQTQNIERRGSAYRTNLVDILPESNRRARRQSREMQYNEPASGSRPKRSYDNKDDLMKIVQTSRANVESLQEQLRHEREKGQERALREQELEADRLEQAKYRLLGLHERLQEREHNVRRREDALVYRENEDRLLSRGFSRHGPPSPRRERGYLPRDSFMHDDYWG